MYHRRRLQSDKLHKPKNRSSPCQPFGLPGTPGSKAIGIDEISIRKGHDYRIVVSDLIRGHRTEFKYEREVQPTPKLGDWVEVLSEILEKEAKLPRESAARPSACSSNCAGADMTALTTACIGSSRLVHALTAVATIVVADSTWL